MSRPATAARTMLRRTALERAPHLGARGSGLKLSHLVDHVGTAALGTHAEGSSDIALAVLVPPVVDVLVEANELARRIMAAVRDVVDSRVRDTELSVFVATACAATLRQHDRLPTATEEEQLVTRLTAKVIESRLRGDASDPRAFAAVAGPRFLHAWMAGGAQRLNKWPPSDIGLGHDERPPLLTPPVRESRTWLQGTDRSVYSRYALFFDDRARRRVGESQQHACPQDVRSRQVPDALELSVELACQTYGLEHERHHALLRVLAEHADGPAPPDAQRSRLRFVEWDEECQPLPTDEEANDRLVDRFLDLQQAWWRSTTGRLILDRCGEPSAYLHLLRLLLVRRAWQAIAGRERELVDPAGTCSVDGIVGTALTKGVGIELPAVLRGERGLPPPPSLQRTQATLQLVGTRLADGRQAGGGHTDHRGADPSAEEIMNGYEVLLVERGDAAEHELLSRAEFAELMASAGLWKTERWKEDP